MNLHPGLVPYAECRTLFFGNESISPERSVKAIRKDRSTNSNTRQKPNWKLLRRPEPDDREEIVMASFVNVRIGRSVFVALILLVAALMGDNGNRIPGLWETLREWLKS